MKLQAKNNFINQSDSEVLFPVGRVSSMVGRTCASGHAFSWQQQMIYNDVNFTHPVNNGATLFQQTVFVA